MNNVTLSCIALLLVCSPVAAADKPNFVVVMVDDMGYADLGCFGAEIDTPTIDTLAAGGIRFSQFYNTAKCHSSRVCLMSGQWCHKAGSSRLSNAATIAQVLKPAGYFTAMTGKWHLKGNPAADWGFDRYFGHLSGCTNFFTGDKTFRLDDKPWNDFGDDFYTTDANTDYAIKFIDEGIENKKPFFVYIAHNAPHYPLHVREEDFRKYEKRYAAGWDALRRERFARQKKLGLVPAEAELPPRPGVIPAWDSLSAEQKTGERERMAAYAGMIDRVDQQLGRLVDHLKEKGVYENTLIMLFSDNGGCPFDRTRGKAFRPWDPKSYWCYSHNWAWFCNTPLKYYKQNQHEGGIRSAFIAHWPAGLKAGGVFHKPAHLVDILPTLMELGGGSYPEKMDGRTVRPHDGISLVPILKGEAWKGHDHLFFNFSNNYALRRGDWKIASCTGGAWELYNIAKDRFEQNDLASSRPDKVKSMSALYEKIWGKPLKLKPDPGMPTTHKRATKRNKAGRKNKAKKGGR